MGYLVAAACIALLIYGIYRVQRNPKVPEAMDTSMLVEHHTDFAVVTASWKSREDGQGGDIYTVEFTTDGGELVLCDIPAKGALEYKDGSRWFVDQHNGLVTIYQIGEDGERAGVYYHQAPVFVEDDFDPERDTPISDVFEPPELFGPEERRESTPEEAQLERELSQGEVLSPMTFRAVDSTGDLPGYYPLSLLRLSGMPPFLRRVDTLQEQCRDAFRLACQALAVDNGQTGTAQSIQEDFWRNNSFVAVVRIRELRDWEYELEAEFHINAYRDDAEED